MYQDLLAERLAQLRMKKGVSARDMSLSLGQADNYINHIENKKSLPSMASFFNICEYLNVTPMDFFNFDATDPVILKDITQDLTSLSSEQLSNVAGIVKGLKR